MTPEIQALLQQWNALNKSDRFVFQKLIQMMDGRNIQLGTGTGTKIGTSTAQKLGFYGVTPIVQAGSISYPSGGTTVDSQARAAISSLITALHNLGLTA